MVAEWRPRRLNLAFFGVFLSHRELQLSRSEMTEVPTEKEWLDNISGATWDDETKRCAVAQVRKAGLRSFGRIPAGFELRMHPEDCGCGAGASNGNASRSDGDGCSKRGDD